MHTLGQKHIDFLRLLADNSNKIHEAPEDIDESDLHQMVQEGLIIQYNGLIKKYTVTSNGSRVARSYGENGELEKIAIQWAMSKGATKEEAEQALKIHGAERLLRAKAEDEGQGTGNKEVTMKIGESGRVEFKAFKSI